MKQLYDKSTARTGFTLTLLAKGEVEIGSVCFPPKICTRTHMLPFAESTHFTSLSFVRRRVGVGLGVGHSPGRDPRAVNKPLF